MHEVIRIENGITRRPEWQMAEPVNFTLNNNEHIAIFGNNACGKSMFIDIITGRHPLIQKKTKYKSGANNKYFISDNIKYITFKDSYGDSDGTYYLQQRWNQHDIDENTPTVHQFLEEAYYKSGNDTTEHRTFQKHIYKLLDIEHLLDKYIITISSGELRKIQIIRTLLSKPRILIIDNPFIGLDNNTRLQLKKILKLLINEFTLQIIIVVSKSSDIPDFITHVIEIKNMKVCPKKSLYEYITTPIKIPEHILSKEKETAILNLKYKSISYKTDEIVNMTDVCIKYGNKTILNNFNWTIKNGEKWALYGQNGTGKSTILSLICADNPQSYACNISLFGCKRGSGESIWDIKKHIGYISPEMHRAYKQNIPAIKVVASGLKDSVGLYIRPTEEDYIICRWWMNIFGIDNLCNRPFLSLSSGEQRLVLLTRAFVKDPELLILDEPFHGLDDMNRIMVTDIINTFCKRKNKTLIIVSHYLNEIPECVTKSKTISRI